MTRAPSRRGAAPERRSWRHGTVTRPVRGSRVRSLRWLFTLLVLLLIGVFAVAVLPMFRQARNVVAIAIWATDPLAVGPIPYATEDVAALGRIRDVVPRHSLGLQDQASFSRLGDQLREIAGARDDLLALYLVAHGVSDGDQAYIVCSDFMRSEGQGRYPVRDLLDQLAKCPGRLRLLVLDAGRLGFEPRLGMAANEFSRLVARDVEALDEQELWVLLPCRPLERTAVAHPWRQSLFGYSVADALQGNANLDPSDRYVTLYELYQHVWNQSARWAGGFEGIRQTPLLMKAGVGIVQPGTREDAKFYRLVWVERPEPPAEPATGDDSSPAAPEQQPAGTPPAQAADLANAQPTPADGGAQPQPAANPGAQTAAESQSVASQSPAAESQPAGSEAAAPPASPQPPATPQERLRQTLAEAWALRDDLQEFPADPELSPIHVAPHLWRELNARLLHFEHQLWSGNPLDRQADAGPDPAAGTERLDHALQLLRDDLRLLQARWNAPATEAPGQFRYDVVRRLDEARHRASSTSTRSADPADQLPEVQQVRAAAFGWNRLVYEARDYVRWYDLASLSDSTPLPIFQDLRQYLESLADFQDVLARLQVQPLSSEELRLLTDARQEFEALRALRNALEGQLRIREQNALLDLQQPRHQQQIEDLLATPRLPGPRRGELLERLLTASATLAPARGGPPSGGGISPARAQRLLERLELESRWMRLVDPQQASALQPQISEIADMLRAAQLDEDRFWNQCRRAGQTMRAFYAGLPLRQEYVALHLVEPQDAERMSGPAAAFTFDLDVRITPRLVLQGPDQLQLIGTRPTPVTITLLANQRELVDRPVSLSFDRQLLKVVAEPEEEPARAQEGWFGKSLTWQVSALRDQEQVGYREVELAMAIEAPGSADPQPQTHRTRLVLPQPNRIDLQVVRDGSTAPGLESSGQAALDLFPNRVTSYRFALLNRSGVERQVEVELYAVPAGSRSQARPGSPTATRRPSSAAEIPNAQPVLPAPLMITLPADGRPVPVDWVAPAELPAPKPEGGEAAEEAKPAPAPPPDFAPVDATAGLLCVIRDQENPDQVWPQWISWQILSPRRFLDAQVGYDARRREIVATLRAADPPAGDPVSIAWIDDEGHLPGEGRKQLTGKLPSGGAVELFAAAPPDRRTRRVRLDVDGYPRGLVYEVRCEPGDRGFLPGSDVRRTDHRVRINRLVAAEFPYEFHFPPYVYQPAVPPKPAAAGEAAPLTPVLVAAGEYVALPAPCPLLRVDFEVDAPGDAFGKQDERVELTLGQSPTPALTLFDDRQITTHVVGLGADGLVELQTAVGDYTVEFSPGALENVRTYLELRLLPPAARPEDRKPPDRALLALVSHPPTIEVVELLSAATRETLPLVGGVYQVTRGTRLIARVQLRTLAGVRHAEYTFARPAATPPGGEPGKLYRPKAQPPVNDRQVFDMPLDTKDLEEERYRLVVAARDLADHDSRPAEVELRFITPPPPAPVLGVIAGWVRYGPNQVSVQGNRPFTVIIEGPGGWKQTMTARGDGYFAVRNLPPGEYTVAASGSFSNNTAGGKLPGVQPSPPNAIKPITVVVE